MISTDYRGPGTYELLISGKQVAVFNCRDEKDFKKKKADLDNRQTGRNSVGRKTYKKIPN